MTLPKKLIIEGSKSLEIKRTINDLIDYLTAKEEAESKKVEEPDAVNTYRMTLQTATLPVEEVIEPEVPVGTVEEISEKMVRVKRVRGWERMSTENWAKESASK
jgi:hypothetical protein